ncbi:MAG: carboxypeptidase-like regulatory domain-containing protein [Bacteroidota bacterium]
MKQFFSTLLALCLTTIVFAQSGIIRGNVFDEENGEPIIYGTVFVQDTDRGTTTDLDGFFTIPNLEAGEYTLLFSYTGFGTKEVTVKVGSGIEYVRVYLTSEATELATVNVSAEREQARSDVQVSKVTVSPKEIRALPATGGEADIAQYLTVIPGIVSSGDQGGQVYIRGGSPVQNKILLDGITIYNPFHSIGFFSVFETETIKSVDVLTGGFNAEYGGRVSAVVDIKTRSGNQRRLSGLVSASPFQAKALIEGPIKPLDPETGNSMSFLLTGKHSYLDQTSKALYSYAVDTDYYSFAGQDEEIQPEDIGLPFNYTDLYGKFSINGGNGSKLDLFGFNFRDGFSVPAIADLGWTNNGGGANFNLIPQNSNIIINGTLSYSDYNIELIESDEAPRRSGISTTNALLNFAYFGRNSQINYGFEFNGFNTDFIFNNPLNLQFKQEDFTTELSAYFKYKYTIGDLIIEPGLRYQFYASQGTSSLEPRFGLKYNATDFLRFKAAGGTYSQNLISTVNDLDIVNFFIGFLAGPEETIFEPNSNVPTADRIQRAVHGIFGVEVDLSNKITTNLEGYYKGFPQLIAINRNKLNTSDPDFITETGYAYGVDFSIKYETDRSYVWGTYSYGHVRRDDGIEEYPTNFDRRHNINVLISYLVGDKRDIELGVRWNLGTGFPFTQTQGFYQNANLQANPAGVDFLTGNFPLDVLLADNLNGGRLATFHRLDASVKKKWKIGRYGGLEALISVTNAYNRENVFYVDRITNNRVDQLPILPSAGLTFSW